MFLLELRVFGVFENLTAYLQNLKGTIRGIFEDFIDRLEQDNGKDIIKLILSFIVCSKKGINLFITKVINLMLRIIGKRNG